MVKPDNSNSKIGEGSIFEGRFYINGSLRIDGRFDGEVRSEDQIYIGETGKVKTNLFAKKVIVGGTIIGDIKAQDEVTLLETGRILGDITTPNLNLTKGVVVMGKINITGGQKKEVKKVIEESFSSGQMPTFSPKKDSKKKGYSIVSEEEEEK